VLPLPFRLLRYAAVFLAVALALLLRWPLWGVLGSELAFLFFWPVVVFCAWYGGLAEGLLATSLSALAAAFFLLEAASRPADLLGLATFAGVGVALSVLGQGRLQAQRWLRLTLSSIGDGVIATDAQGRVQFLNAAAEGLTGRTQAEAAGRPLAEVFRIVNEQTRQPAESPVQQVMATGTVVGLANHTLLLARDGRETPVADGAAPIRDREGAVLGVVLVFRDAGAQRRAERALAEADRQKDRFLAMLSHELRNCLAPAFNALDAVRLGLGSRQQLLEILDRQVRQMGRLVDDLLDLSRVRQGQLTLRKEPVDLGRVVAAAVETSLPRLQARKQELAVSLPERPVRLEADPARLVQVLANLLNNAARYSDEGGRVVLSAEREAGEVVLRVRDSGMGIAPGVLHLLFQPFVRSERAAGRSREGLGIGLALVKSLVEMHGGGVAAFSEGPGRGSEFVVRLPLATTQEQA
jgi:PAS domain S-box-containing protein